MKLEKAGVLYIIACSENNKDGTKHTHVFFKTTSPMNTIQANYFDWNERHPNIDSARDVKATINYVKKDGNW